MLKASALFVLTQGPTPELAPDDHDSLKQNIIVQSAEGAFCVPKSIINLARCLMEKDEIIKDVIVELRKQINAKSHEFSLDLSEKNLEEREVVANLFDNMLGMISCITHSGDYKNINGKLVNTSRVKGFILGQYLELALYDLADEILQELSEKYKKSYKIMRNALIQDANGMLKNEFDLLIEFDGIYYVVEIKSGKVVNRIDFDKYVQIGRQYGIVPDRFLLVANYLNQQQIEQIEWFCEYKASNIVGDSFKQKLMAMIDKDQK